MKYRFTQRSIYDSKPCNGLDSFACSPLAMLKRIQMNKKTRNTITSFFSPLFKRGGTSMHAIKVDRAIMLETISMSYHSFPATFDIE